MTTSIQTNEREKFHNLFYSFGTEYLDKMTQNGVCRGTFIGIPGLQEDELTDFASALFCKFATSNKPKLTDKEVQEKKEPLLLYITFKDNIPAVLRNIYYYLKKEQDGELTADQVSELDMKSVTEYVVSRLTANGFDFKFCQLNPSVMTHLTLTDYFSKLESSGYSLQFTTIDHIFLLQNTGSTEKPYGYYKRDSVRHVRNFCVERGTILVSPFLLSDEAASLFNAAENKNNFVKEVNGGGYYKDCKTIDQELDLEFYIHTFPKVQGKYITIQRGKHRSPILVEDKYLYFAGLM